MWVSGNDTITLTGLGNDYADIYPNVARFARLGNLYDVEVNGYANITVTSSLTNIDPNLAKSLAILHTSATGADTYAGDPTQSTPQRHGVHTTGGLVHRHRRLCRRNTNAVAQPDYLGNRRRPIWRAHRPRTTALSAGRLSTTTATPWALPSHRHCRRSQLLCRPGTDYGLDTYTSDDTQRTDTIQGVGNGGPTYRYQANGFNLVRAYAASFTTSSAILTLASGEVFSGTYSGTTVNGPLVGGVPAYVHYLAGFPSVVATAAPGATNTTAYLQKFATADFYMDETATLDGTDGLHSGESKGVNYDNFVKHFGNVIVSVLNP